MENSETFQQDQIVSEDKRDNRSRGRNRDDRNNRDDSQRGRRKGGKFDKKRQKPEFEERIVEIRRVTKVVKGGKNMRFAALVVIGDMKGRVGYGTGKAAEVPEAIRKAVESAKKNMIKVPMVGTTVPHRIQGRFGSGEVLIMPAKEGTGVIAGGAARAILELAGYKDVRSKSLGSKSARSVVNATIDGLKSLRTIDEVAALRGKTVEELIG